MAQLLNRAKLATLLVDLLTSEEEAVDLRTAQLRFDIGLLAARLGATIKWCRSRPETEALPLGLFGASTGAAAALVVAAEHHSARLPVPYWLLARPNNCQNF